MSRPRFLVDQDFNNHIVQGVRRREPGVEFLRLSEIGMAEEDDAAVLAHAAAEGWIVLSHDVNTMSDAAYARLNAGEPMKRLLLAHQQTPPARIIQDLLLIWFSSEAEEWAGQVWFLPL